MTRLPKNALVILMIASVLATLQVTNVIADESNTINGHVVEGTYGNSVPSNLTVSLLIISSDGMVERRIATVKPDGSFVFIDVRFTGTEAFTLTTVYQDVLYELPLGPLPSSPVELLVYEATQEWDNLSVDGTTVVVTEAVAQNRHLTVSEIVQLTNKGTRTVVPDLEHPQLMNFLRFSLPHNFQELHVRSGLPSGQVVSVGEGFALTSPVPPGTHDVLFSYQVPYNESSRADLSRSFPFTTDMFRLLIPEELGPAQSPNLAYIGNRILGEKTYQLYEIHGLSPGTRIEIFLIDLPTPSLFQQFLDWVSQRKFSTVGIPLVLGLILTSVLINSMRRQKRNTSLVASHSTSSDEPETRQGLLEAIAKLENRFQCGDVSMEAYRNQRQFLKERLLASSLKQSTIVNENLEISCK